MKNIYYLLGIQSYANHDSGASILKYDKKKEQQIMSLYQKKDCLEKNIHTPFLYTL